MKDRSDRINRPGDIEFAAARGFQKPTGRCLDLELVDETLQTYSHPMLGAFGKITALTVGGIPWETRWMLAEGPDPGPGQYVVEVEERRVRLGSPPMGGAVTVWGKEPD